MPKLKQSGLEGHYSDSFYYEWYIEFDDSTEMFMFNDDGTDRMLRDVWDYTTTSDIKRMGMIPFSTAKADAINNSDSHQFTVISSTRKSQYYNVPPPKKGFVPWVMKRKQHVGGYIQTFFEFGPDKDGNEFYIVNSEGSIQGPHTTRPVLWIIN